MNYFGGFVCSSWCDYRASLAMLSSMPGAGPCCKLRPGSAEYRSYVNNWPEEKR